MPMIQILGNPTNPLHYLSCCGIFEILSRLDPLATSFWRCDSPVAMCLNTSLEEPALAACVRDFCCNTEAWTFIKMPEQSSVYRVDVRFGLGNSSTVMSLDWWQETLDQEGEIDRKSAWKMYAGQQTAEKIISDMNAECSALAPALPEPASFTSLLNISKGMTGRFGFDPRSSRSALDVGYSPNDIGLPVATYPFAELLATIGIQTFFPSRCGIPGRLSSTRGWLAPAKGSAAAFHYRLWKLPLPICLARAAATSPSVSLGILLSAPRATRKNYSNLTMARPA